jgi:hypothetical protein
MRLRLSFLKPETRHLSAIPSKAKRKRGNQILQQIWCETQDYGHQDTGGYSSLQDVTIPPLDHSDHGKERLAQVHLNFDAKSQ